MSLTPTHPREGALQSVPPGSSDGQRSLLKLIAVSTPLAVVWVLTWNPLCLLVSLAGLLVGIYLGRHPGDTWRGLVASARHIYRVCLSTAHRRHYTLIGLLVLALATVAQHPAWFAARGPVADAASLSQVKVVTRVLTRVIVQPSEALRATDRLTRPAVTSNLSGYILHSPSISSGTIQRALEAMGSPLATAIWYGPGGVQKRMSNYLYDAGKATGVDPAVMLAISFNESHGGRDGAASSTYSIGNERPWSDNGVPMECWHGSCYRFHTSWAQGVDAECILLRSYALGLHGFAKMPRWIDAVSVYAPAGDQNNPASYAAVVYGKLHDWETR